jgi:hypothetical protein
MKRNFSSLILGIAAVSSLTFASVRAEAKKSATNGPQQNRAFTDALAEARRLADTDAGKAYQNEFGKKWLRRAWVTSSANARRIRARQLSLRLFLFCGQRSAGIRARS